MAQTINCVKPNQSKLRLCYSCSCVGHVKYYHESVFLCESDPLLLRLELC